MHRYGATIYFCCNFLQCTWRARRIVEDFHIRKCVAKAHHTREQCFALTGMIFLHHCTVRDSAVVIVIVIRSQPRRGGQNTRRGSWRPVPYSEALWIRAAGARSPRSSCGIAVALACRRANRGSRSGRDGCSAGAGTAGPRRCLWHMRTRSLDDAEPPTSTTMYQTCARARDRSTRHERPCAAAYPSCWPGPPRRPMRPTRLAPRSLPVRTYELPHGVAIGADGRCTHVARMKEVTYYCRADTSLDMTGVELVGNDTVTSAPTYGVSVLNRAGVTLRGGRLRGAAPTARTHTRTHRNYALTHLAPHNRTHVRCVPTLPHTLHTR
jgi:hypothetical protein